MPSEGGLFEVATYLVASARDCLDEPLDYGPLRLLEGVNRLIKLSRREPSLKDPFLEEMEARISEDVLKVMSDRDAFKKAIDDLLLDFAEEMRKRKLG
jgi:Family of unknown function (DUF6092)